MKSKAAPKSTDNVCTDKHTSNQSGAAAADGGGGGFCPTYTYYLVVVVGILYFYVPS